MIQRMPEHRPTAVSATQQSLPLVPSDHRLIAHSDSPSEICIDFATKFQFRCRVVLNLGHNEKYDDNEDDDGN